MERYRWTSIPVLCICMALAFISLMYAQPLNQPAPVAPTPSGPSPTPESGSLEQVKVAALDGFEPDNTPAQATVILDGQSQKHSISPVGDVDWARFSLTERSGVSLQTAGETGDTELTLYDSALNQIDYDDDGGVGFFSRIDRSCVDDPLEAGTYFVKVEEYGNDSEIDHYALSFDSTTCWASSYVYLPFLAKPAPAGCGLLPNGNFEGGHTVWTEYSTHAWPLIVQDFPGDVTPHSGTWAVWLGGDYDDISYIRQNTTVPTSCPILGYWCWSASVDACGYDYGGVLVDGTVKEVYDLCTSKSTGGWVGHFVDLSAYAGRSVPIEIRAETDATLNSNLFIDDVGWYRPGLTSEQVASFEFEPERAEPRPGVPVPQVTEKVDRPLPGQLLREFARR